MLPLDLHVLSLPLAFILSQDQTLHCIISYKSQFESWLFLILCGTPDEESPGIDALVLIVFFGTCSCTPSELPDSRRLFGTRKFLPLSLFNELLNLLHLFGVCFIRLHSSVSHYQKVTPSFLNRLLRIHPKILSEVSMNLFLRPPCGSCRTPVSERDCKGTPFFFTCKFFRNFFLTFLQTFFAINAN